MKRVLFSLMSVCIIFLSCKKDHSKYTNPEQPLYKISFKVGFTQQITNFKVNSLATNSFTTNSVDTSLTNKIDILYYAVYDSLGNSVHIIKQLSTDANFGSYTDNLPSGKYTVVIAGGKAGLVLGPPKNVNMSKLSTDIIYYGYFNNDNTGYYNHFNKDAFFKKVSLTVSETNAIQNVSLDRLVSELEVNIQDALPASAKFIQITINKGLSDRFFIGSAIAGSTDAISLGPITVSHTITKADSGTTNNKLTTLFLYSSPMTVDLQCLSGISESAPASTIIAEKNITNVTGSPNTYTILTGNLFGGTGTSSTGGFQTLIDTAWDPTPIVKSFP